MPHLLQLFNTTLEVQTNTIKYKTREITGKAKTKSTLCAEIQRKCVDIQLSISLKWWHKIIKYKLIVFLNSNNNNRKHHRKISRYREITKHLALSFKKWDVWDDSIIKKDFLARYPRQSPGSVSCSYSVWMEQTQGYPFSQHPTTLQYIFRSQPLKPLSHPWPLSPANTVFWA